MMTTKSIPHDKLADTVFMRSMVKRVMNDGQMILVEACTFVAGMIDDATGWDVYRAIDEDCVRRDLEARA